nr:MAG TPA: Regulatory protein repA [Caudoviricetes sp.]
MASGEFDLVPLLSYIDPDESYETWIQVGMALKHEGYSLTIWEDWSRKGNKFHDGECSRKWDSFGEETDTIVTGATITNLAKSGGWKNEDSPIAMNARLPDDLTILDTEYIEPEQLKVPTDTAWTNKARAEELINYVKALFDDDEIVSYTTKSFKDKDGKFKPIEEGLHIYAGDMVKRLKQYGRIDLAIGSQTISSDEDDSPLSGGAWIRFNPMNGNGAKNSDVTSYRYTLIESDKMSVSKQIAMIRALELPVAALVYSGGKSVHAIVRVDADTFKEYQRRVQFIYEICEKNGFKADTQNKNPSRLSRMPGEYRGDKKQFLIATNIGHGSYKEWLEYVEEAADDLPPFTDLEEVFSNPPELAPELIHGVLRQGHKMLFVGPSKAGKSFALIELAIAIAEGGTWLDFQCSQGKVLYINLEIDSASCIHRFIDVYNALGMPPENLQNIEIWNLRGAAIPMDKLAPKIIRRAKKYGFKAIIIDPIYKVIMGDENAAGDMAKFCNQFDLLCRDLGCSTIYCHHHSKGPQGQKKAMDRASGSGVFARDPDAVIDVTPLSAKEETGQLNAFKVSGILREFPPFKEFCIVYHYPIHTVDHSGFLDMAAVEGSLEDLQERGRDSSRKVREAGKNSRREQIVLLIEGALSSGNQITQKQLAERFNCSIRTIRNDLTEINTPLEVYKTDMLGAITRVR